MNCKSHPSASWNQVLSPFSLKDKDNPTKSDVSHLNFIEILDTVRETLGEPIKASGPPISESEELVMGTPKATTGASPQVATEPIDLKKLGNDKNQAIIALEGLLITMNTLEKQVQTLWTSYHADNQMSLITATITTFMAIKLIFALEAEINELHRKYDIYALVQELHHKATKKDDKTSFSGFEIDFDYYLLAEEHYIPQLWMASAFHQNWSKIQKAITRGKPASVGFEAAKKKLLDGPNQKAKEENDQKYQDRCVRSLDFVLRTIDQILVPMVKGGGMPQLHRVLYPSMDPLTEMIANPSDICLCNEGSRSDVYDFKGPGSSLWRQAFETCFRLQCCRESFC